MNALTLTAGVLTMSSREIAELVNSRHDSVKRTIERCAEKGIFDIPPLVEYLDLMGRSGQLEYQLNKRSSLIVVAQLCPEFTARIVDRWQELEAQAVPSGLKDFREVAKLLKANEARFREFLYERVIMYRLGGEWVAYQRHIDAGRFEVKAGTSPHSSRAFNRSMFTPKGVEWIAGLWAVEQLRADGCK